MAGEYAVVTIAVPHGCDASSTTKVRIQMPETIPAVTPTINAGWDVEKVMETLAEPIQGEHGEITERVSEVVYTAKTPLPDGYRDTFALSIKVPDDASGLMFFPTVQICEVGESDWIETPADGQDPFELEKPAPFVNVVAPTDNADAATDGDTVTDGETVDGSERHRRRRRGRCVRRFRRRRQQRARHRRARRRPARRGHRRRRHRPHPQGLSQTGVNWTGVNWAGVNP